LAPGLQSLEHFLREDDAFLVQELEAFADELAFLLELEEGAARRAEAGLWHRLVPRAFAGGLRLGALRGRSGAGRAPGCDAGVLDLDVLGELGAGEARHLRGRQCAQQLPAQRHGLLQRARAVLGDEARLESVAELEELAVVLR